MHNEQLNYVEFKPATSEAMMDSSADYVSRWEQASNQNSHPVVFEHNLGVIPSLITVLFSADKQTVYPLTWSWLREASGNPVTISMNHKVIRLEIYDGVPLHGVWTPKDDWSLYKEGYFKAFAWK